MELTFFEAVQQGLESNSRIIKQKRKIASLKRKLKESELEQDWQWEIEGEGRVVSSNTRTTSQKKLASLEGEKEFEQGLTINPELSLSEKEVLDQGLNKDSIDFELALEQPLYPVMKSDEAGKKETKLFRLKREQAKLQQLQNKLVLYWLDDYLELIELKFKKQISKSEYKLLTQKDIEQQSEKKKLKAKIKLNKAQQTWEKSKNKYQEKLASLKLDLGLESKDELLISLTEKLDLQWLTELEAGFLSFDNSEQLLKQAAANNSDLLINQLQQQQIKREQVEQERNEKPEIDFTADYDASDQQWQIALNLTHKLFNQQQNKLEREELQSDLEALQEQEQQYHKDLEIKINQLVGEITVNQLQVEERELRLEAEVLDLEELDPASPQDEGVNFEYQEQKIDLQEAELFLKKKQHQLLLSKYELIKLLGGLAV